MALHFASSKSQNKRDYVTVCARACKCQTCTQKIDVYVEVVTELINLNMLHNILFFLSFPCLLSATHTHTNARADTLTPHLVTPGLRAWQRRAPRMQLCRRFRRWTRDRVLLLPYLRPVSIHRVCSPCKMDMLTASFIPFTTSATSGE